MATRRTMPIGAELGDGGLHVRVWAPTHSRVVLLLDDGQKTLLEPSARGYHTGFVAGAGAGVRYRFQIDDAEVPDPASRFQPEGPMGPSEVIDPRAFAWTDQDWRGIAADRHVLYEMHIGTFTPEGTYRAAAEALPYLADVGITTLELMPLNECAGRHNWGYDGVNYFAPSHNYGTPDELRGFVDRAHACGLAVILDVVYNHFGPSGNTLFQWSPYYKAERATEWGDAFNFDGPHNEGVRELVLENAGYWIREFHLDGLRIDATQSMTDTSDRHILAELADRVRHEAGDRQVFLVGENEPQDARLFDHLDALWNDDFHHTARLAACGHGDGYLHDYRATPQAFISALKRGFLYQGQLYPWQKQPRGTSTRGIARRRFVHFIENHDQVANMAFGERLIDVTDPGTFRALTAVLLLGPELPLLFQGQEMGSRAPWVFFVDHCEDLKTPIRKGRAEFVAQFARLATPEAQAALPDPCDEATYLRCKLDPALRDRANPIVRLHRDLLALRRTDPAFLDDRDDALDGAVLSPTAFAIRYFQDGATGDRLLLVNLGPTFSEAVVPEPLVAPPAGTAWKLAWSSEHPSYGGHGTPEPFDAERGLTIPARSAVLVEPRGVRA